MIDTTSFMLGNLDIYILISKIYESPLFYWLSFFIIISWLVTWLGYCEVSGFNEAHWNLNQ